MYDDNGYINLKTIYPSYTCHLFLSCPWEDRTIRRLIGDGKLAARLTGKDNRQTGSEQECPICFLQYDQINMLQCCKATICTECYLQIQDPKDRNSPCPFCNHETMDVVVAKRLESDEVAKREEEEQKVIEASIRARANSVSSHGSNNSSNGSGNFGSRLNEELKRTRSRTLSDVGSPSSGLDGGSEEHHGSSLLENNLNISHVAMTPEERRELENEMRSQLSHPLMVEMQRNAEIESQRHLLEHAESRRDRLRSSREQIERLRNRVRENGLNFLNNHRRGGFDYDDDNDDDDDIYNFGSSGAGGTSDTRGGGATRSSTRPNIDDLYLLEAALYLSSREDSIRRRGNRNRAAERRHRNHHALLRAILSGGIGEDVNEENSNEDNNDHDTGSNTQRDSRHQLTPADFLVGLSEDNQLEMAIQLSLREAEERERQQQEEGESGGNDENGENGENGEEEERLNNTTATPGDPQDSGEHLEDERIILSTTENLSSNEGQSSVNNSAESPS